MEGLQIIHNPDRPGAVEMLAVAGVGVGLGLLGAFASNAVAPKPVLGGRTNTHFLAMIGAGAAIYYVGFAAGYLRPMGGYLSK